MESGKSRAGNTRSSNVACVSPARAVPAAAGVPATEGVPWPAGVPAAGEEVSYICNASGMLATMPEEPAESINPSATSRQMAMNKRESSTRRVIVSTSHG